MLRQALAHRLALAVLRRYPLAWQQRYEDEVRTLIEDVPPRWRDICELFRGLIVERVRELLTDHEQPRRTAWLLGLINPAFAIVLVATGWLVGVRLRAMLGGWSPAAQEAGAAVLVILLPVAFVVLFRARTRPFDFSSPPYPPWVGMTFLPCLFAGIALTVWGQPFEGDHTARFQSFSTMYNWYMLCFFASDIASSVFPTQQMLAAFATVQGAEQQIASNRQLAESCREWIAKGVRSPLEQAEREIVRWTQIREDALERLRQQGYRTRFERHSPGPMADPSLQHGASGTPDHK